MKTVEEIVQEKEYYELTQEELQLVSELAQTETEYNELKHLFYEGRRFFSGRKVQASNDMRAHIMEKLYPPTTSSVKWYQSVWVFLFPPQKSFYQYPAFQLIGLLVVFMGVFSLWRSPFQSQELAKNTTIVEKEMVVEKSDNPKKEVELPSSPVKGYTKQIEEEPAAEADIKNEELDESALDSRDAFESNQLMDMSTNTNSISGNGDLSLKPQSSAIDFGKDKYDNIPKVAEIVAEEVEIIDKDVKTHSYDDESITTNDSKVSVSRLEKKEARFSQPQKTAVSSGLFREISKTAVLNCTQISNLEALFFEVK